MQTRFETNKRLVHHFHVQIGCLFCDIIYMNQGHTKLCKEGSNVLFFLAVTEQSHDSHVIRIVGSKYDIIMQYMQRKKRKSTLDTSISALIRVSFAHHPVT